MQKTLPRRITVGCKGILMATSFLKSTMLPLQNGNECSTNRFSNNTMLYLI